MTLADNKKKLVVIAGPTAVGKTSLTIKLAEHFSSEIISADSRQFYREMKIGTAAPTIEEMRKINHHFIGNLSVTDDYSAGKFEADALSKLSDLYNNHRIIFMTGGSGLFIQAVTEGFDTFQEVDPEIRAHIRVKYKNEGLAWLQNEVKVLDAEYFEKADINNPQRLLRALEVSRSTGKPYSSFKSGISKPRDFSIIKILLNEDREEIYNKINQRVENMLIAGWLEETRSLLPFRKLNALNTVGYKELFEYLDGSLSLEKAVELIKQNTRRYAKRQLTWFRNDKNYKVFSPNDFKKIISFLETDMKSHDFQ